MDSFSLIIKLIILKDKCKIFTENTITYNHNLKKDKISYKKDITKYEYV